MGQEKQAKPDLLVLSASVKIILIIELCAGAHRIYPGVKKKISEITLSYNQIDGILKLMK